MRFMLIKGESCFVFSDEKDPSPKYAIKLAYMTAETASGHGRHLPGQDHHLTTVELRNSLGDVEYQLVFDRADVASEFVRVVRERAAVAQAEEVKKVRRW